MASPAAALAFSAWMLMRSAPASANCRSGIRDCVLHHEMDVKGLGREFPQGATRSGKNNRAARNGHPRHRCGRYRESSMRRRSRSRFTRSADQSEDFGHEAV